MACDALVAVVGGPLGTPVRSLVANYLSGQWGWRHVAWIAEKASEFHNAKYKQDKILAYGIAGMLVARGATDGDGLLYQTCRAVCLIQLAAKFLDSCNQIGLLATRINNTYCESYVSVPESQYLKWKQIAQDCAQLAVVVVFTAATVLRFQDVLLNDTSMKQGIQFEGYACIVETALKVGREPAKVEAYFADMMQSVGQTLGLGDFSKMTASLTDLCSKAIKQLPALPSTT